MTNHLSDSTVQNADFLIVGGGLAAATAAETLRTAGAEGSVVILSAECLPPYNRPPLSKSYLTGDKDEARLLVQPESFYRQHAIDLRLKTRALSVDPQRQIVSTEHENISYGQLLIATGAPRSGWMRPARILTACSVSAPKRMPFVCARRPATRGEQSSLGAAILAWKSPFP